MSGALWPRRAAVSGRAGASSSSRLPAPGWCRNSSNHSNERTHSHLGASSSCSNSRSRGSVGDAASCQGTRRSSQRRTAVLVRALFEPPPFQPSKLYIAFGPGATAVSPAPPHSRRYTLTHNDITGELWLTVGADYNTAQISGFYTRLLRDEVTAEWRSDGAHTVPSLHVFCHVSGEERWLAPPVLRNYIFRREMPLVLDCVIHAEQELLKRSPHLARAPVFVHFQSAVERLDSIECWGILGERSTWQAVPTSLLKRLLYGIIGVTLEPDFVAPKARFLEPGTTLQPSLPRGFMLSPVVAAANLSADVEDDAIAVNVQELLGRSQQQQQQQQHDSSDDLGASQEARHSFNGCGPNGSSPNGTSNGSSSSSSGSSNGNSSHGSSSSSSCSSNGISRYHSSNGASTPGTGGSTPGALPATGGPVADAIISGESEGSQAVVGVAALEGTTGSSRVSKLAVLVPEPVQLRVSGPMVGSAIDDQVVEALNGSLLLSRARKSAQLLSSRRK